MSRALLISPDPRDSHRPVTSMRDDGTADRFVQAARVSSRYRGEPTAASPVTTRSASERRGSDQVVAPPEQSGTIGHTRGVGTDARFSSRRDEDTTAQSGRDESGATRGSG